MDKQTRKSVIKLLKSAIAKIEDHENWVKHHSHPPSDKFCLNGALLAAGSVGTFVSFKARQAVAAAIHNTSDFYAIFDFNDHPDTTHKDVLSVLSIALEEVTHG